MNNFSFRNNFTLLFAKCNPDLDVSPRFYHDPEPGNKEMSTDTLCTLSQVLNVSTDYILFGTSETNDPADSNDMKVYETLLQSCPKEKHTRLIDTVTCYLKALRE